jgi:hypothetical protein
VAEVFQEQLNMVTYTEWIEIGFDVYEELGGDYPGSETAPDVMQELAGFWNRNREELITIGQREARRIAQNQMQL